MEKASSIYQGREEVSISMASRTPLYNPNGPPLKASAGTVLITHDFEIGGAGMENYPWDVYDHRQCPRIFLGKANGQIVSIFP